MFDSTVLQVVIGLMFLLAVFAVVVSALTEMVSRWLGLRSFHLVRGIRALVDGDWSPDTTTITTYRLFKSVFIGTAGQKGRTTAVQEQERGATEQPLRRTADDPEFGTTYTKLADDGTQFEQLTASLKTNRKARRSLPSYIASRQFSSAVLGEILPVREDENDPTAPPSLTGVREQIAAKFGDSPLREALDKIVDEVGTDVDKMRLKLETVYDDHMDRVSGWYKRNTKWFQLLFAVVVVFAFNFNLVRVAEHLQGSEDSRAALVASAENTNCDTECVQNTLDELTALNVPVLWQDASSCSDDDSCNFWERKGIWDSSDSTPVNILVIVLGYALAIAGLLPGSRFWFDALAKLNTLRSGGKPPPKADASSG